MSNLSDKVAAEAVDAVKEVAERPTNTLDPASVAGAAPSLEKAISDNVAQVVKHVTNQEPWYRSRVTLGALLAAAAGLAGALGYAFPEEMQGKVLDIVIAAGPIIGAMIALYGRWVATKPLGA
jgi:hypothetical protein